jgi:CubicO group peptidase (beta-lactamase class C family)
MQHHDTDGRTGSLINRRDFVVSAAATVAAASLQRAVIAGNSRVVVDRKLVQELVDDAARALGVIGGQLALFDGERIHEFTTGLAIRERALAVTPDTLFQIGSTTKVFNAAVIMALVDDGVLDLDAPVTTWIENFRVPGAEATERITLRRLISMSAGIDNGPYQDHGRGDDALARYVESLASIPMVFEPGTAFGYSNACTNISGLAAQRAAGKSWEILLAEKVLAPLSLEHSATFAEEILFHPYALGYGYRPESPDPVRVPYWGLPRSMAPAGASLCCSAGDLVRFAGMFLSGGRAADGTRVTSAAGITTMQTPQVTLPNRITAEKWCPGPYWKLWGGEEIFGHSGTNTGGSSMLLWCPSRNVAIATIANVPAQGYPFADRIFDTVFPEVFGIKKPATPRPSDVTPARVELGRFTGQFVAWMKRVTFDVEDGRLIARVFHREGSVANEPVMTSELIPLGGDRFLPADPAMGGNRGWDVAFWGDDGAGRATHYLDGVFAMRRFH